eukprot:CAMPEP_0172717350 /NCGR_PEP_ID=MMETSP1074-20121228/71168_1 /TAXON_ID=2916 /ORGANISM="Ceratium fusus, Strain PA161109" /LENGTH=50 /DNA_ID=CAMNT_0013542271 /DNA_START=502 /DNA_END=650 /DNA_ORIENTATION=+
MAHQGAPAVEVFSTYGFVATGGLSGWATPSLALPKSKTVTKRSKNTPPNT